MFVLTIKPGICRPAHVAADAHRQKQCGLCQVGPHLLPRVLRREDPKYPQRRHRAPCEPCFLRPRDGLSRAWLAPQCGARRSLGCPAPVFKVQHRGRGDRFPGGWARGGTPPASLRTGSPISWAWLPCPLPSPDPSSREESHLCPAALGHLPGLPGRQGGTVPQKRQTFTLSCRACVLLRCLFQNRNLASSSHKQKAHHSVFPPNKRAVGLSLHKEGLRL